MATSAQKAEFYRVYGPIVEEQCRGTGLYPEVILAQLALESDYGVSPAAHGNLGGRKVSESQKANGVEGEDYKIRKTHEKFSSQEEADAFVKQQKDLGYRVYGKTKKQGDEFVVYVDQPFEISGDGSPEDNVRGQIEFLEKNPRYRRNGVFDAESPEAQAKALKKAGYATDGGYAGKLIEVYSQDDFPTFDSSELTQEDYENYYEGAESVTVEGDNIIVDFGGGNVVTEPKFTVDNRIRAERDIEEEGGIVGAQDRTSTGQQNPPVIPPVTGPGIEGDTQTVTNVSEDDSEPTGLSNEQATSNDVDGAEYEVTYEEAQRVYGPTANIVNQNGVDRIVYTDSEGVVQTVDLDTVTEDTPNYTPPVNITEAEDIVIEDQESVQDRTSQTPPVVVPEVIEEDVNVESTDDGQATPTTTTASTETQDDNQEDETEEVVDTEETQEMPEVPEGLDGGGLFYKDGNSYNVDDQGNVTLSQEGYSPEVPENAQPGDLFQDNDGNTYKLLPNGEIDYITPTELSDIDNPVIINAADDTNDDLNEQDPAEGITAPEGSNPGDVFTVDDKDYTVKEDGSVEFIGNAQIEEQTNTQVVEQSSLTQEEIEEIYGPNARITVANGEERIIYPDANGDEKEITMSDAVLARDNQIALEEELQQEKNANLLGLRRKDFKDLSEDDLNARLDETTLSDQEKEQVKRKWTNANKEGLLDKLYNQFKAGDGKALEKAGDLLKSAGGVSSLVAGFIGAKAAKRGLEEVPVPRLEGLSTAFKQYSQQQKALAESGLSYAERQTLEQGIDQAYEAGIQNLVRGTAGDRAKFLAGTGALDFNRQTSLLKVAALEDEARRQNRSAYGDLLKFEVTQDREKDLFTKSREYNQKLADKAMFQNTASAAFQHVFDNIRFGQDYKPLMDQMNKTVNQLGNVSQLLGDLNIEITDPNDPNEENNEEGNR